MLFFTQILSIFPTFADREKVYYFLLFAPEEIVQFDVIVSPAQS